MEVWVVASWSSKEECLGGPWDGTDWDFRRYMVGSGEYAGDVGSAGMLTLMKIGLAIYLPRDGKMYTD